MSVTGSRLAYVNGKKWGEHVIERSRVQAPAGAAGEFSSPESASCADSYFGLRSTPVLPR